MLSRVYIIICLACITLQASAQDKTNEFRKGFYFGAAIGISSVQLQTTGFARDRQTGMSVPNFRFGYRYSERAGIALLLPGTVYKYNIEGRKRDRGFEGIVPCFQFWPSNRWWLLAGAGVAMDAPAFYDIRDESERKFFFGPSALAAAGYEVWRHNRFSLDIQTRVHFGYTEVPQGRRNGTAFNLMIGLNWY